MMCPLNYKPFDNHLGFNIKTLLHPHKNQINVYHFHFCPIEIDIAKIIENKTMQHYGCSMTCYMHFLVKWGLLKGALKQKKIAQRND